MFDIMIIVVIMKKNFKQLIYLIKDEYIEQTAFILLLLWTISPMVEYIFKNFCTSLYTYYFHFIIYFIGLFGFILYTVHIVKNKIKGKINIKKFIPEILIMILVILGLVASILSKNTYLSFFGDDYRREGLIIYIMYVGFILLASVFKNKKYIKILMKSMIASCLTITIVPLFNSNFTYIEFSNVFHQFNHYGYYLMINVVLSAFMFLESDKIIKRIIYLIIYIFFLYLLIRNDTFGCFLAILISLILLFIYSMVKKYKRMNIIMIILIFVITSLTVSHFDIKIGERVNFKNTQGLVGKNLTTFTKDVKNIVNKDDKGIDKAGTGRGLLWKEAINYTLEHPIFGGGMECLKSHYMLKNIDYNDRPHNILLQISSFIGIPGAVVYVALIFYIAITNLKIMKHDTIHIMIYTTAMTYFISSIVGNSMYYTSPYFMILLGLLIGFNRCKNEQIRLTK